MRYISVTIMLPYFIVYHSVLFMFCLMSSVNCWRIPEFNCISTDVPRSVWVVSDAAGWAVVCFVPKQSFFNTLQTQSEYHLQAKRNSDSYITIRHFSFVVTAFKLSCLCGVIVKSSQRSNERWHRFMSISPSKLQTEIWKTFRYTPH